MADSKIYLDVPYTQKDAAKALGARWDAANKKWYVPADKVLTLFTQWQTESVLLQSPTENTGPKSPASANKNSSSTKNGASGVITYPEDNNFVAYSGDEPPWE